MTAKTIRTNLSDVNQLRNSEFRRFWRVFLGRKIVVLFGLVILAMIILALFAPYIAPHDPDNQNLRMALKNPTLEHLLGTDALGRDLLSRIIYGARVSLIVGLVSVGGALFIGTILGMLAGFTGKITDSVISRLTDAVLSIPSIILALAIALIFGPGMWTVIVAILVGLLPAYIRVMRGQVLVVKENDYVMAAEAIGASNFRIMMNHLLPNCLSPIIVQTTLNLGVAILAEAALSFLGIGIVGQPAWGAMVSEGRRFLLEKPMLSFAPGVCVMLTVLAFNMVGDALRDALDPRLRGSI